MFRKIFCLTMIILMFSSTVIAAETIKIGLMAPLTGDWSQSGKEMKLVVDLLAKQYNGSGGVLGKNIEVVAFDDQGTPEGAVTAAQHLVKQSVMAVIGSVTSSATEASQDIFNRARILQISNASSAVGLTEKNLKYFFRTCPRDDEQSRVIIQTIQKMKLSKLAILYDGNTSYATGLAQDVGKIARQNHIETVYYGALTPGRESYLEILEKVKSRNPDAVFFAGYYMDTAALLKQKEAMDWHVVLIGGDGANNPALPTAAGKKAAQGFYFISPPLPRELDTDQAKWFLAEFKKTTGSPPQMIDSILAGEALRVIVQAIRETKSIEPDVIADHLHGSFDDLTGLTGRINFNAKGDRVSDLYGVYRVDAEGRFVIQRMFQFGKIVK
jgi:branched-chain amino acid transport system substrate-binding protein